MVLKSKENLPQEQKAEVGQKKSPKLERRPKQEIERQLYTWRWMESNFQVKDVQTSNKRTSQSEKEKAEIAEKEKQKKEDTGICLAGCLSIFFLAFVVIIVIATVSVIMEKNTNTTINVNKSAVSTKDE